MRREYADNGDMGEMTVLAIDDDPTQLELLRTIIESIEFPHVEYLSSETAEAGLQLVEEHTVDLILSDYRLPDRSGLEVLEEVKKRNPLISVVVMTAFESSQDAVEILKKGGDDYLVKPTKKSEIEHLIVRVFEQRSITRENRTVHEAIDQSFDYLPIVYRSQKMRNLLNLVSRSAQSDATVLLTGESGTGKELLARLIHQSGPRKKRPFVTVNIAALPESLMESELFGHVKGAFTGAVNDRIGRFEEADGGSLFIDEVGDIPPSIQVKLLRIIQFGQLQRIGENTTRELDVRIIAATNRDLEDMVAQGSFRADLFWRLNVIHIPIPPLRERKEDILALTDHFVEHFSKKNQRSIRGLSREALDKLMSYPFPGNVRELENIIERATIMSRGELISRENLHLQEREASVQKCEDELIETLETGEIDMEWRLRQLESALIKKSLKASEGNQSEAARRLGISERKLRSRMKILQIKNPKQT
ncbi:MAG TPA: sigma-54-dependent Fis family transcriptional regulator [Sediminispirochaeta sp.]|nr:sigma-54-dependent Fis family transcriptional regulator [Sediminispirochaeta sp.]